MKYPNIQSFFMFTATFLFLMNNTHAATMYRHIPFTTSISSADTIVVNYDFTGKKGIHCTGNSKWDMNFVYKGFQRNVSLPVVLQSDHIPDKKVEVLADVSGQFNIAINAHNSSNKTQYTDITCDYASSRVD